MTSAKCSPKRNPQRSAYGLLSNDDPRVRLGPYRIRKNNPLPRELVSPETVVCPHLAAAFICFRVHSVANVSFVSEVDSKAWVNGSPCETAKTSYSVKRETEQARVMRSKKKYGMLV